MPFTRRTTLATGFGAAVSGLLPGRLMAAGGAELEAFTKGAPVTAEGITLSVPNIAENGFSVPVSVSAPGARAILVVAPANPVPSVVTFRFGPLSGAQQVSTRIRLARTQDLVAVAELADGRFVKASVPVIVVVGGCGS